MKLEWNDTKDCMTAYYRGHIIHIDKKPNYFGKYELTVWTTEKMNMEFMKADESHNEDACRVFMEWRDIADMFGRQRPHRIEPDSKEVGDCIDFIDRVAEWVIASFNELGDSQSSIRDKFVGELSKGE